MSTEEQTEQTEQTSPESESAPAESSSSGSNSHQVYRVNRLGREIFAGDKDLLIKAIQARRVRGDDLIYDQAQELWGFARKHHVFLEATGQGLEESQRTREKQSSLGKWLRFLVNATVIVLVLYLLISYSEKIEFKLREETNELKSRSELSSSQSAADSDGSGEGAGNGEDGSSGEEQGEGQGLGSGGGSTLRESFKGEIKQIFDLNAEGMRDASLVIENTLSDEELLAQVQYVNAITTDALRDQGQVDQQNFAKLQEARAIATFVTMRNMKHEGARLLLSQINHQLKKVCALLYSKPFCDLKTKHPEWKDTVIAAILKNEILYGMMPSQVEASWGRASRIRRERGGYLYCYGSGCDRSVWMIEGQVREILPSPDTEVRQAQKQRQEESLQKNQRTQKKRRSKTPKNTQRTQKKDL